MQQRTINQGGALLEKSVISGILDVEHGIVPLGRWGNKFIGPWGTLHFHLPPRDLAKWDVGGRWGGGGGGGGGEKNFS